MPSPEPSTDKPTTETKTETNAVEEVQQKSDGSTMKRILLGRSDAGGSALDRLKKPWSKAMEADDTEGRHRLVLEGADASKKAAEDKAAVKEAAAADAADKAESESSGNGNGNKLKEDTKKQEKKAGPVKLAGFADPKPVGASPSKKIEEEIKNKKRQR